MDKSKAFELYKVKYNIQIDWLNLHQKTSQQYFALISAIFAASLATFFNYLDKPISDITLFGFALNIFLGVAGIKLCHRYYQRFLEEITILAKIEPILGLDDDRIVEADNKVRPFPKDKYYLPKRWIDSRRKSETSDEFVIEKMKAGANKYVRWSFVFLIFANFIFCLVIIIRFVLESRWSKLLK